MVGGNTILLDPAGEGKVAARTSHPAQEGGASMEDESAVHFSCAAAKSFAASLLKLRGGFRQTESPRPLMRWRTPSVWPVWADHDRNFVVLTRT